MGAMKGLKHGRKASVSAGGSASSGTVPFNELRFVDLTLSAEEKEQFRSLLSSGQLDELQFDTWLESGYSFKLRRSPDGRGVSATLTCDKREHVCGGGVLSAFAGDAATAIALLRYKDEYLAGEYGWHEAALRRIGDQQDIR